MTTEEELLEYYISQEKATVDFKDLLQDLLAMRKPIDEIVEFSIGHGFDCGFNYSFITQETLVGENKHPKMPLVRFQFLNGNDEIVTVETHIKEIFRGSDYVHGYCDGKSYLRSRIVGIIELIEFNGYACIDIKN